MIFMNKDTKQSLLKPKQKKILEYPRQKKTYPQNWPSYDQAQMMEYKMFHELLYSLVDYKIKDEPRKVGRPKNSKKERLFCMILRVYFGKSSRRLRGFLEYAHRKGYITKIPSFNSLCRYFREEEMLEILLDLIDETSKPLKDYETNFAADSSGFGTTMYSHWFNHEYQQHKSRRGFLKANLMIGIRTHIVTAAIVSKGRVNECKGFLELIDKTAKNFKINEVTGDAAYCSMYNIGRVIEHGGKPYLLFRSNATLFPQCRSKRSDAWMRSLYEFNKKKDYFMQKYHKRSNVEACFSMIKKKLNPNLRSKDELGQKNELLCNLVAHNLIILISEMFESGVKIDWLYQNGD